MEHLYTIHSDKLQDGGAKITTEQWIKDQIAESDNQFNEITCTYLNSGKCTKYEQRFNCCRNYPQIGRYCSSDKCRIMSINVSNNTEESNDICAECENKCCTHILVPIKSNIKEEFIEKWMNIDCSTCGKLLNK